MTMTRSRTAPIPVRGRRPRPAPGERARVGVDPVVRRQEPSPYGLPLAVGFGDVGTGCALALVGDDGTEPAAGLAESWPALRLLPPVDPADGPVDLRLTARGRHALSAGALVIGAVLVTAAWFGNQGASSRPTGPVPATLVVHDGDTLWSIAQRIAPGRDPRDEVSDLRRLNRLVSTVLAPGQSLRTR